MGRALILFALAACSSASVRAEWLAELDAGFLHDSNLNNAELERDIRSDSAVFASFAGGQFIQLNRDVSLTMTADVKSEAYRRTSGMNHLAAGASLALRRKLGVGASAPWLRLSLSAARLEYEAQVRDGWLYRGTLTAGQRVAQSWDVQAQYSVEKRTGDHATPAVRTVSGDVFDLRSQSVALDVRYSLSEDTLFFAGYSWRDGDVVSSSTPSSKIFRASSAITRDPVFGTNTFAYKLEAITRLVTVGVSQTISPSSALSLSYQRQLTHAAGDNHYVKNVFAVTCSRRFF